MNIGRRSLFGLFAGLVAGPALAKGKPEPSALLAQAEDTIEVSPSPISRAKVLPHKSLVAEPLPYKVVAYAKAGEMCLTSDGKELSSWDVHVLLDGEPLKYCVAAKQYGGKLHDWGWAEVYDGADWKAPHIQKYGQIRIVEGPLPGPKEN